MRSIKPADSSTTARRPANVARRGMFDFQVAADVSIARQLLAPMLDRSQAWMARTNPPRQNLPDSTLLL